MAKQMDAYWMPFTANRQFKQSPRLLAKAKGIHFWTPEGREILDGVAGLWCVNAGHGRPKIVRAIAEQAAELDFAPPFQMAHPKAFELAEKLVEITPAGLSKVFYTNSGSEAVETALKMAIAYHRARGDGAASSCARCPASRPNVPSCLSRLLGARRAGAHHRRHRRALADADCRACADRSLGRCRRRRDQALRLNLRSSRLNKEAA